MRWAVRAYAAPHMGHCLARAVSVAADSESWAESSLSAVLERGFDERVSFRAMECRGRKPNIGWSIQAGYGPGLVTEKNLNIEC